MSDLTDQAAAALSQGQMGQAASLARQALNEDPEDAEAKGLLGLVDLRQSKLRTALPMLSEAIQAGAENSELPSALSHVYARMNGTEATLSHLKGLLVHRPTFTALRLVLAQLYYEFDRPEEELAICEDGIAAGDGSSELQLIKGRALIACERPEDAAKVLEALVEQDKSDPTGAYLLGVALRGAGHLKEARDAQLEAMRRVPFYAPSLYLYMRSGRVAEDDPVFAKFDQLETILTGASDDDAGYYHAAMGKAFEDLGRYDEAWTHYAHGARAQKRTLKYQRRNIEGRFERVKALFSAQLIEQFRGLSNSEARPIFIIGMPRSGSTLLERILSAHKDVQGLGELLELEKLSNPWIEKALTGNLDRPELARISETYWESAQHRAGCGDTVLVDKGLHNFFFVGMIHLLFPKATILHTMRDPLDTCFSCFSLRFAKGHTWSNDLGDLAHYYRHYHSLMHHWDEVLPGRVVSVRYEDLATDFETNVRRILDACDLPWDPACLNFHEAGGVVRTASATQVREPVNTKSIGRWQSFEPHLKALKTELAEFQ